MKTRARPLAPLLVASLLLATGAGAPARTALTDEDVVRMFVSGVPEEEIILRIEAAEVDFDLSDEMVQELSLAGIPGSVLKAMRRRQAELRPPAPDPAGEVEEPVGSRLRVVLNPESTTESGAKRPQLRLLDAIDPVTFEALQLRGDTDRFTDIAIVLACLTADHVPDHWRSKSPLGRDFNSAPRHRVLVFVPGATHSGSGKAKPGILSLEIPEALEADVEPDTAHDLLLGVAVRAGERYLLLGRDARRDVVVDERGLTLRAKVGGGKSMGPGAMAAKFLEDTAETDQASAD